MKELQLIIDTAPMGHRGNFIFFKNYRITVITEKLFRIERSERKRFCDKATQAVLFRDLGAVDFEVETYNDNVVISTRCVKLNLFEDKSLSRVTFDGATYYLSQSENLLGTYRTLDGFEGDECKCEASANHKGDKVKLCDGVCARNGFAVLDDSKSLVLDSNGGLLQRKADSTDEYIFVYGKDYRGALKAYYDISGHVPMLPRVVLGNWWSRYYAYTEKTYMQLLSRFSEEKVPLSVATIDMDWHYSYDVDEQKHITEQGLNDDYHGGNNGWTGFSWNKKLFPDYVRFLKDVHDKGLAVSLNLHPADGIRWWEDMYVQFAESLGVDSNTKVKLPFKVADERFMKSYFDIVLAPYEKDGVDIWWIDWQQGKTCEIENLDPLWLINHYHYLHAKESGKLPVILSRFCGAGSHRYPLGFSGDTYISWKTLDYLPYFTATATNIGYTWWSHDIGGHFEGECDTELYLRFLQFGVFSPINRLHSSNNPVIRKEPWSYKNGICEIAERFLRLRHKIVPLLYTAAYENNVYGQALVEPMYYGYGDDVRSFEYKNQYIFAKQMIVAPITKKSSCVFGSAKVWLPQGEWTDFFTGDIYKGGREFDAYRTLDSIPVFVKSGSIIPLSEDEYTNGCPLPKNLTFRIYPGDGGKYALYEDSSSGKVFTILTLKMFKNEILLDVKIEGDVEIIPSDRRITFIFFNVPDHLNDVRVSTGFERNVSDNLSFTISVKSLIDQKSVSIKTTYNRLDRVETVKKYCSDILSFVEGDNGVKETLYNEIMTMKTLKQIVEHIKASRLLDESIKTKLLEIMYD